MFCRKYVFGVVLDGFASCLTPASRSLQHPPASLSLAPFPLCSLYMAYTSGLGDWALHSGGQKCCDGRFSNVRAAFRHSSPSSYSLLLAHFFLLSAMHRTLEGGNVHVISHSTEHENLKNHLIGQTVYLYSIAD